MQTPQSKKLIVTEKIGEIEISDPYRWLEDISDPNVKRWVNLQNQYTDSFLRNETQQKFSTELVENFQVTNFSNPIPVRGRYFYTERQPNEDQKVLYFKDGLNGAPVKLVDPNGRKANNTVTIDYWSPGWTGKYMIYGMSAGGDEMATLYVMDVEKQENLSDTIINCRYSSVVWLPDDSGFFYTRNPRPGTVPANEEHLHSKVYFHQLGDDPNNDRLIFGDNRPREDMIKLSSSMDGRYLAINVFQNWTENEIFIYDRNKDEVTPLTTPVRAQFSIHFLVDKVILYTNYKANNFRILATNLTGLYKNIDTWEEFLPESDNLLESIALTAEHILLEYLKDVCSEMIVLDHSGKRLGEVPLPEYSSLAGITARQTEQEFFYRLESFTFPSVIYRFNPVVGTYEHYRSTDNPINPKEYAVKQEWYQSKDGVEIPMFILHKIGTKLNGENPTILYGYGGFGTNLTPFFMRNWVPWIAHGGIFAVANIRGGGEFGDRWHETGIKQHKQNSFDDFIGAAEHLISMKYTNHKHLGILGASNGGLLVSAVAVQRPELFSAVCSKVPLTDMIRFPKFGIAVRWTHEYGNPEINEELALILQWSPYHNVRMGKEYPNTLFTTAEKDTRVDPLHARKMTAMLQSVKQKNKTLLYTETEAGHGAGKPISKIIESQSLALTFFAKELSLKV